MVGRRSNYSTSECTIDAFIASEIKKHIWLSLDTALDPILRLYGSSGNRLGCCGRRLLAAGPCDGTGSVVERFARVASRRSVMTT